MILSTSVESEEESQMAFGSEFQRVGAAMEKVPLTLQVLCLVPGCVCVCFNALMQSSFSNYSHVIMTIWIEKRVLSASVLDGY